MIFDTSLSDYSRLSIAADQLSQEDFDAAQRRARPSIDAEYLADLWQPWRSYGLDWLAGRTLQEERDEVWNAVLEVERGPKYSRADRKAERELVRDHFKNWGAFTTAELREAHIEPRHRDYTMAWFRKIGFARPLKGVKGTWEVLASYRGTTTVDRRIGRPDDAAEASAL